jgi:hypothetical protein
MSSGATVPPYLFEAPGNHPAPYTFSVAASLEVQPYTAHAIFDGTNASGDFRPCLTFYSADGVRLGRYFPATVVTAGDVAEVTYTPPFGSAAVDSGGGGISEIDSSDGSIVVSDPTGPTVDLAVAPALQERLAGSISTTGGGGGQLSYSHTSGSTLVNLGTPTAPAIVAAGNYAVTFVGSWLVTSHLLTDYVRWFFALSPTFTVVAAMTMPLASAAPSAVAALEVSCAYVGRIAAGQTLQFTVDNDSASALDFTSLVTIDRIGN